MGISLVAGRQLDRTKRFGLKSSRRRSSWPAKNIFVNMSFLNLSISAVRLWVVNRGRGQKFKPFPRRAW